MKLTNPFLKAIMSFAVPNGCLKRPFSLVLNNIVDFHLFTVYFFILFASLKAF